AYASPFFLAGSGNEHRIAYLADIMAGKVAGRGSPGDTTLFCSVGLAGTEVVVASAILEAHHNRKIDAPSGTALMLGEAADEGRGVSLASVERR
ncbi:dihydrodipicolinate reductase C-terminal domain-containing protein, partial [Rhizobium leguminosarum]|uniref:dihydrodipicolinate reductase C-terminal domain-containing protein n=1 Tax=Rhizobium leguminosarum TaxID=384 RepID=UPI003F9D8E36